MTSQALFSRRHSSYTVIIVTFRRLDKLRQSKAAQILTVGSEQSKHSSDGKHYPHPHSSSEEHRSDQSEDEDVSQASLEQSAGGSEGLTDTSSPLSREGHGRPTEQNSSPYRSKFQLLRILEGKMAESDELCGQNLR